MCEVALWRGGRVRSPGCVCLYVCPLHCIYKPCLVAIPPGFSIPQRANATHISHCSVVMDTFQQTKRRCRVQCRDIVVTLCAHAIHSKSSLVHESFSKLDCVEILWKVKLSSPANVASSILLSWNCVANSLELLIFYHLLRAIYAETPMTAVDLLQCK